MNGASTEVWAKIMIAPTSIITKIRGRSHHFFRTRMNAHSSLAMPEFAMHPPWLRTCFYLTETRLYGKPTSCLRALPPLHWNWLLETIPTKP